MHLTYLLMQGHMTGSCSKLEAHQFNDKQPTGRLHRAFSVFLFNSERKLLLQQRAASKVGYSVLFLAPADSCQQTL